MRSALTAHSECFEAAQCGDSTNTLRRPTAAGLVTLVWLLPTPLCQAQRSAQYAHSQPAVCCHTLPPTVYSSTKLVAAGRSRSWFDRSGPLRCQYRPASTSPLGQHVNPAPAAVSCGMLSC